jgi:thiol-disulfide isomerase/thioredoxin
MLRLLPALLLLAACAPAAPPSAPHDLLGKPIELSLPTDKGQLAALPAPGAVVTVADFFGPTCGPCARKVPALHAKKGEIEAAGGRLVLVAVLADSETTDDARKALASWGVSGASFLVDTGDASKREAGVRSLPTTLVLDRKGVVRWSAPVEASAEDVVAAARAGR